MANIRLIKRRIKTAKNIAQITKAMELVAAAKMRKAQTAALAGKLYADKIYEMVLRLSRRTDYANHPLLKTPKVIDKKLILLISANKGLCGGLNTGLFRYFVNFYSGGGYEAITLGKRGADFLTRTGTAVKADFSDTTPWEKAVPALAELITAEFIAGKFDGVDVVYNEFISIVNQKPKKKTLLPLTIALPAGSEEKEQDSEFLIEPSVAEVFDALLPHYLENQLRDAILQAEASEHSARMMAMHNATDNAVSLTEELTLAYNKARQEKITYEITDMVTARIAVE